MHPFEQGSTVNLIGLRIRYGSAYIQWQLLIFIFYCLTTMIKEPGVFSQRYLMRKSKENTLHPTRDSLAGHANKENTNHLNNHHTHVHPTAEHDFPLAYTSAKTHSRERTSVSANRKQERRNDQKAQQELEERTELIGRLQRELKESRGIDIFMQNKRGDWQRKHRPSIRSTIRISMNSTKS